MFPLMFTILFEKQAKVLGEEKQAKVLGED